MATPYISIDDLIFDKYWYANMFIYNLNTDNLLYYFL